MRKTILITAIAATICASAANAPEGTLKRMAPKGAKASSEWTFNVSEEDIIRELPAGTAKEIWAKWGDYYTMSMFGIGQNTAKGVPCTIGLGEDETVFLTPFSGVDTGSYLRGTIEGDRMVFKLPQAIYADSGDGDERYVYVAQMCHFEADDPDDPESAGLYYTESGETEMVFLKEGEKWVMQMPAEVNGHPVIMGLVAADDGTWCGYSDWNTSLAPFADDLVEAPAGLQTEEWVLLAPESESGKHLVSQSITAGTDGNDFYMRGLSALFPDSWVKGTVDGNKITFPSRQYLGANENSYAFGYFFGATMEETTDPDWGFTYTQYTFQNQLTFDYDPATRKLTTEMALIINKGSEELNMETAFAAPRIYPQGTVTDFKPMDPVPGFYSPMGDFPGSLYFGFPSINAEGQMLDTSKLFYSVYLDGEPMTFYTDEYPGLQEDTEMIPYTFSNQNNIGYYGPGNLSHFFNFTISGYDRMDIQTFYIDGDKKFESAIVNVVDESGIDAVETGASAVETRWYDLTGRRVENPAAGIYLKSMRMADGSLRTVKTAVR